MALGWMNVLHSLRMARVRRNYQRLSKDSREKILEVINREGRNNPACQVLVATAPEDAAPSSSIDSHYGGRPYAEENDDWPRLGAQSDQPADFLIQVRLGDSFPDPWAGRLIVIFSQNDVDQLVRCYCDSSVERAIKLMGGPEPQKLWELRPVQIPKCQQSEGQTSEQGGSNDGPLAYDPVILLETVPGLREEMSKLPGRPADLLAAILAPNHCGYGFELSHIVQLGGEPVWLQIDLGGLDCPVCSKEMRFLFQFGDLNEGILLGDSGVCYVFGCDDHIEQTRAIVEKC